MKVRRLDHVSIGTNRLQETRKFYVELLGLEEGPRPKLKSKGYWLYAGEDAVIHLVEKGTNPDALTDAHEAPDRKSWKHGNADKTDVLEAGSDDHIALSVVDSLGAVQLMKDNGLPYWDRLLADRGLYQVFVLDPNGVVVELNDYSPDLNAIDPMTVQGRD
ncbi:MAG: VOC family protein [Pseudomonadota bacterium]|nr:VOC family protein [Pseudomonadota bacterium]